MISHIQLFVYVFYIYQSKGGLTANVKLHFFIVLGAMAKLQWTGGDAWKRLKNYFSHGMVQHFIE